MKRLLTTIICFVLALFTIAPTSVFAAETTIEPVLESIEFNNATLDSAFSSNTYDYTITLTNTNATPTLKSYSLNGSANLFINYSYDEAKHQNGITATVEYNIDATNVQTVYTFMYSNVEYSKSSDNSLQEVSCYLGEVYPEINETDTDYDLYVPSDTTEITLSATTNDTSAFAQIPGTVTLAEDQELSIPITVIAGNGATKTYNFNVKRLDKTSAQIKKDMNDPDFESIIDGERFYQKPEFIVITCAVLGGILLLLLFITIAKRITVKVGDDDEVEFFELD